MEADNNLNPQDSNPKLRWYSPKPSRALAILLAVEMALWLTENCFSKGWAVLFAIAAVGITIGCLLLCYALALFFRWNFRFSLRSLMVLTVAVALPFSWLAVKLEQNREQRSHIEAISQKGGQIWYQDDPPKFVQFWMAPNRIAAEEPLGPAWLRRWLGDDFFREAVQVDFEFRLSAIFDEGLEDAARHVANLPGLETVCLNCNQITEAGLVHLTKLDKIKNLTISDTRSPLTDKDLERLCELKNLETLNLRNTAITDDGLVHLQKLPHLRCLFLYSRNITGKGMSVLASLPNLKEVILYDPNIYRQEVEDARLKRPDLKILLESTWNNPNAKNY